MAWFYNNYSGEAAQESGLAASAYVAATKTGTGWHEYATKQQMMAAIKAHGWKAPTGSVTTGLGNAAHGAATTVASASGLGSLNRLAGDLTSGKLWLRVGKVVLGGVLIVAGFLELSHSKKTVMDIAKNAGKAALA